MYESIRRGMTLIATAGEAVGVVNEKTDGFFDACAMRGLTGVHGVLIPASNVPHLMLRHDVAEAVQKGLFHIYPVATIDAGIALLTGLIAGEGGARGGGPGAARGGRV